MIPVRVPVDAPTYQVGGPRTLQPDDRMRKTLCPVCDEWLLDRPVALVYVGMPPSDGERPQPATGAAVVIHATCSAPGAQFEGEPPFHHYLSTACWHAQNDDDAAMHAGCRNRCKFCPSCCVCPCHGEAGTQPGVSEVDMERDRFMRLLAVVREHGIDLAKAEPDLHHDLLYGPTMFWARAKGQPAGEWRPTNTTETKES